MKNKKTVVYRIDMFNEKAGSIEDGKIYANYKLVAYYDEGQIYQIKGWFFPQKILIGSYENGHVYKGKNKRTHIGEYERGSIYRGKGFFREKVGKYRGEEGGPAAALMLLFYKEVYEIW